MRLLDTTTIRLGDCAAVVGCDEFYRHLLGVITSMVAWDMRMIMRYSTSEAPQYVLADDVPANQIETYLSSFYRLDPFFEYWRKQQCEGVVRMREAKSARKLITAYFQIFQPQTGMRDGLGVFLPSAGDTAIALCLERRTPFSPSEAKQLSGILPMLVGLNTSHERARAADQSAKHASAAEAANTGTQQIALPPFDINEASRNFLKNELTPRERQIVGLIVQGHSSFEIGSQLQISEGTVKNHRKRLYKKLGIFSERDLLAQFIEHLTAR